MGRKLFYVNAPSNAEIMNWHKQGQMQIKIPSRPATDISLLTEKIVSKEDMESMYAWAFGSNWRMEIQWKDLSLFVGTKRSFFTKNIGLFEIIEAEWWWTLNVVSENKDLIKITHQIWTYFKNKASQQSNYIISRKNYEETVLHTTK